jgi:hypothetical protein
MNDTLLSEAQDQTDFAENHVEIAQTAIKHSDPKTAYENLTFAEAHVAKAKRLLNEVIGAS